ncbi:SAM-dependent methyltransferase [Actinoplanes sp. DH11]|uniref:SAM-dependent methyltransferase n=1 Tax=Actinoplanes sp. DH11 TaxID=2857011 RepID=UPI001E36257B|nr:SAM-dependent methyltransferase [Actinoplanes sp. DH11]
MIGGLQWRIPHSARQINYLIGGKDHFQADRDSVERAQLLVPQLRTAVRQHRAFAHRAVRYLAGVGVRQFIDIGCGMPFHPNTHDIAQSADASARVLYVDNDPTVGAHAQALLIARGTVAFAAGDVRRPKTILNSEAVTTDPAGDPGALIDLTRPVGVLLLGVLDQSTDDPIEPAQQLISALPSGSHVVLSHATLDFMPDRERHGAAAVIAAVDLWHPRTLAEISPIIDGLQPIDPEWVSTAAWRPSPDTHVVRDTEALFYGVVARVP